jgi:DNA polymerase-3 subunit beta
VELPVAFDQKEIGITFDARYVVDMLRVLNEESTVNLDLIDHQSAAVFKTDDAYTYIVMPLTRER